LHPNKKPSVLGNTNRVQVSGSNIIHQELIYRPGTNASQFINDNLSLTQRSIFSQGGGKLQLPGKGTTGLVSSRKQGSMTMTHASNIVRLQTSPHHGGRNSGRNS